MGIDNFAPMDIISPFQDVRQALRSLLREKGVTLAALLSLALGIGANAALFSVVYGVLFRPLPYPAPDRLVRLSEYHPGAQAGVPGPLFTNFTYHAWAEGRTIEGIGGFSVERFTDTTADGPVPIMGTAVTPSVFRLLGVRPALGRLLIDEDSKESAPAVAVLADGLWKERFGGDASVIGKTLILDGVIHTVVGVAPPGFYFPEREGRLWTSYSIPRGSADPRNQSIRIFGAIARLKPGATLQQAAEEGTLRARSVARPPVEDALFGKGGPVAVRVETLLAEMTGRIRPALLLFAVGVGFVLLIACANVASLQLTRGVSRQREIAVRMALGASRFRLVRQLVTESLVLSAAGGFLGVLLGSALVTALPAVAPASFPRLEDVALDRPSFVFAALISVMAGLLSGVLPALRSSRTSLTPALRDGSGASVGVATQRLRNGLVAVEAALAVMLLVGAGLLLRSFSELMSVDPGYASGNVLIASLNVPAEDRPQAATLALAEQMTERAKALPGVVAAGVSNMTPLDSSTAVASFDLPDARAPEGKVKARATRYYVSPGFAEALSLKLKEGRLLRAEDGRSATESLLVNEEFARVYLDDGQPVVGRRYSGLFSNQDPPITTEIVGVIANVLKDGLDARPQTEVYSLPRFGRRLPADFQLVLRTGESDPASLGPALRAMIRELDPTATLDINTLASRVSASVAQPRFAAVTVAAFGLLALALAAAGLYGALSYSVTLRKRELGVRSALGASRRDIVRLVLRQGLIVAGGGLALGMAAALTLSRFLESLLFGVTPMDPIAFLAAPALLLGAAILACLIPAWRGASVDPTEALRCE